MTQIHAYLCPFSFFFFFDFFLAFFADFFSLVNSSHFFLIKRGHLPQCFPFFLNLPQHFFFTFFVTIQPK